MIDMQSARATMVEGQVRPNQVHDPRVIGAMRALPREAFAPSGANPYADIDLPLGEGRFMLAPMAIARMVQLVLEFDPEQVLVIAAGSGYGAALLAMAGAQVVALDEDARLDTGALARFVPSAKRVTGPLAEGWPPLAPYDAIMIEGAVVAVPPALAPQLKPHGRVVAIQAHGDAAVGLGAIVVAEPSVNGFACSAAFDCTARLLPSLRPAPAFEF
jgi:protein-L-isoaspartate(D-aspartate) O-methyltransferase